MNNQTSELLNQLATKLGTTTQYLWSVLLKQAPISALTTLMYLVIIIVGGFILYGANKRFSKQHKDTTRDYERTTCDYEEHEHLGVVMVISLIIWAIAFLVVFLSLSDIINGFFNPEYWALHQILSSVKN